jgi:ParB family chromosome partitioning protein
LTEIEVSDIVPNEYNPNVMPPKAYDRLVEDMRENGPRAIEPILVRRVGRKFEIIDGFNRWRAAKQLAWRTIPANILDVSLEEAKVINYRKNSERGTIDPFKEAELFKSDIDAGMTQEEVAERYGVDRSQVAYRLSLLKISARAREFIDVTRVTPSHLEIIAKVPRAADQEVLAKEVRDKGVSVRELEAKAARLYRLRPVRGRVPKPRDCELKVLLDSVANPYAQCRECGLREECAGITARIGKYRRGRVHEAGS